MQQVALRRYRLIKLNDCIGHQTHLGRGYQRGALVGLHQNLLLLFRLYPSELIIIATASTLNALLLFSPLLSPP